MQEVQDMRLHIIRVLILVGVQFWTIFINFAKVLISLHGYAQNTFYFKKPNKSYSISPSHLRWGRGQGICAGVMWFRHLSCTTSIPPVQQNSSISCFDLSKINENKNEVYVHITIPGKSVLLLFPKHQGTYLQSLFSQIFSYCVFYWKLEDIKIDFTLLKWVMFVFSLES